MDLIGIALFILALVVALRWICQPAEPALIARLRKMASEAQHSNSELRAQLLDATLHREALTEAATEGVLQLHARAKRAEGALAAIRQCPQTKLCPDCARTLERDEVA